MIRFILGTRPEAIKTLPVIRELKRRKVAFEVVHTGQHTELIEGTGLRSDRLLNVPSKNDPMQYVKAALRVLLKTPMPSADWVVVQGDTASAVAGARYGVQRGIKVCHIEAGLRSGHVDDPWPEEGFRMEIDRLADLLCCPTDGNKANVLRDAILLDKLRPQRIVVTGNTVIDAMLHANVARATDCTHALVTLHRRESFGEPLRLILRGLAQIAEEYPDVPFCWPVHPNPEVHAALADVPMPVNVLRRDPLPYPDFLTFLAGARCVLTDSGGVVEEATYLGVPTVIARDHTERPEAIEVGTAKLVGKTTDGVIQGLHWGLDATVEPSSVFGDGHAAGRIADLLM